MRFDELQRRPLLDIRSSSIGAEVIVIPPIPLGISEPTSHVVMTLQNLNSVVVHQSAARWPVLLSVRMAKRSVDESFWRNQAFICGNGGI